jgi:hypothetical protein
MRFLPKFATAILALIVFFYQPIVTHALTLTALVKDTAVIISGYTAPHSLITVFENSAVLGTTSSDQNGFFSKYVSSVAGTHTFSIASTDPDGNSTPNIELNLALIAHQEMTISNIYMPASLKLASDHYTTNDIIKITGYTKPNSQVEITILGNHPLVNNVIANNEGLFVLTVNGATLPPGDYQLLTKLIISGTVDNSTAGNVYTFTIVLGPTPKLTNPTGTKTPTCIYSYSRLCLFDSKDQGFIGYKEEFLNYLNGYLEFSGLAVNNKYDINQDGYVNSIDLSIVLYYWRGDTNLIKGFYTNNHTSIAGANINSVPETKINNALDIVNLMFKCLTLQIFAILLVLMTFLILLLYKRRHSKPNTKE